ncbi:MAG TPA: winged helix DNA-binding domain-containing protein [Candidatus Limnocylindrales bacterium]|nr:winged helix DNA-binding domain-containing protein [Candidatus Limnocylindrales bacterium]
MGGAGDSLTRRLTPRELNRATLARQLLLERARLPVVDGVRRAVALQAQEPPSPYLALWNRLADFDPADLDAAFANQQVVKATLMRVTLHAVAGSDYPAFHEAMQPTLRGARLHDRRFRRSGFTPEEADALLPDVVGFAGSPRSSAEAEGWLDDRLGETPKPGLWWAFRQYGPIVQHPTGGPWAFGPRPAYVAAAQQQRPGEQTASIGWLARRYLEGFGPASLADIGQFTMLGRPLIRDALAAIEDDLVRLEAADGSVLWDVPRAILPAEDAPAPPRLLPMWDSVLLAYADRSRLVPPEYRRRVSQSNGDLLPTILVDGYVAGVWRPVEDGIVVSAFHRLDDDAWDGLATEASALDGFLSSRDRRIYTRYDRWFAEVRPAEVRTLGR